MKQFFLALILLLSLMLCGCSEQTVTDAAEAAIAITEKAVTTVIESIDWEELQDSAKDGYEALIKRYPSLEKENVKSYLKDNGLKLVQKFISSTDEGIQENAQKLGQILKILYPELTEEVDTALSK